MARGPSLSYVSMRPEGFPSSSVISRDAFKLAADPRVSLNLNGTGYGDDLVIVEGTVEVVPDYASGPWPEPGRAEAYYAKYETTLRETLQSSAAEMAGAFSTALRITPTRWRVVP